MTRILYISIISLFLLGCAKEEKVIDSPKIMSLISMTEDDFYRIKEQQIIQMVTDTAKACNIKPYILCGLAYHESSRFLYANRKIKDSNGRFSYGLFMIQLETAKGYDKGATEDKLLNPYYNAHLAAIIFQKNLAKYGKYEYALAAHNAGAVYNNKITNQDFVKKVYTSVGEVVAKYNF
jgi:hypothetical protein